MLFHQFRPARKSQVYIAAISFLAMGATVTALVPQCAAAVATAPAAPDSGLVGYWKLAGDCRDYSGLGNHGTNHGADLSGEGPDGSPNGAAKFDGMNHFIEVMDAPSLRWTDRDFAISVWIRLEEDLTGPVGDIAGKYDPILRKGMNFHISGSSPGYSSLSNSRRVQFGIDNARTGPWIDCGKPWSGNPLISTLVVYDGDLYTGTADADDPKDACRVFRYAGGTKWIDCGRVGDDPMTRSVYSIVVHKGQLYAGTGTWDWERAWKGKGFAGANRVYCYEGGTKWRDCGAFGDGFRVMSLASFKGDLYATDDHGACFRYQGDTRWTKCGQVTGTKIHSMTVYQGDLYGGANTTIYRHDGKAEWVSVSDDLFGENQIHTLQVYGGRLYAGAWPVGRILRYQGGLAWTDCGHVGIAIDKYRINEVNDLVVYNGKLYAGAIPQAEVWRYERDGQWTLLRQLVQNPNWSAENLPSWNRVPCLTVYQGRLFAGTSSCHGRSGPWNLQDCGRVFSMEAGKNVAYDKDLRVGWTHLAVSRQAGLLEMYVDGKLCARSSPFESAQYDISNDKPLFIGFGAENHFRGSVCQVRIYRRALSPADVASLSAWRVRPP